MSYDPTIAQALAEAAVLLSDPASLSETLDAIVRTASNTMSDIDHVGVTLVSHRGERLVTAAASDDLARAFDELQYRTGQGPCVDALDPATPSMNLVQDARHEARWPLFIAPAVRLGLRSQLGVRMFLGDTTVGVLNLYSTRVPEISEETQELAELFATHAALAYGHTDATLNLQAAIRSRERIGQATGLVMERYGLDAHQAFAYLARVSATSETKLRDVADHLVDTADRANRRDGPPGGAAGTAGPEQ